MAVTSGSGLAGQQAVTRRCRRCVWRRGELQRSAATPMRKDVVVAKTSAEQALTGGDDAPRPSDGAAGASDAAGSPVGGQVRSMQAARPQLLRALNEQLLLQHIRQFGPCSRAELARLSGLSKPTVSLALANVERSGLVREAGQRTGVPGRSAVLYEIRPDAGYVLGLDIGRQYLRGALADLTGTVIGPGLAPRQHVERERRRRRADQPRRRAVRVRGPGPAEVTQTVIGSPGVYDPRRNTIALAGGLAGSSKPSVLKQLRAAFGDRLVLENDADAAALAEREHGHGREVGTLRVRLDRHRHRHGPGASTAQLHRGVHGVAGEIAFMPITERPGRRPRRMPGAGARWRRRVRPRPLSAPPAGLGMRGPVTGAPGVRGRGGRGDERAAAVVAAEARARGQAVCAIVTVIDPELVVLGGGIGQAPGFAAAVTSELARLAPVMPDVRVSALGTEAVVDGCLASGAGLAWQRLTALVSLTAQRFAYSPGVTGPEDASLALPSPRMLRWEIFTVFALSLGASGLNALLSLIGSLLINRSLASQQALLVGSRSSNQWLDLVLQLVGIAEALMPVVLVFYLMARSGEGAVGHGPGRSSARPGSAQGSGAGRHHRRRGPGALSGRFSRGRRAQRRAGVRCRPSGGASRC